MRAALAPARTKLISRRAKVARPRSRQTGLRSSDPLYLCRSRTARTRIGRVRRKPIGLRALMPRPRSLPTGPLAPHARTGSRMPRDGAPLDGPRHRMALDAISPNGNAASPVRAAPTLSTPAATALLLASPLGRLPARHHQLHARPPPAVALDLPRPSVGPPLELVVELHRKTVSAATSKVVGMMRSCKVTRRRGVSLETKESG
jgi:hypothetical protein